MEQHLRVLTLGVRDVERSRGFYVDGLGWPLALHVPGEVAFVQIGHGLLLSLWAIEQMVAEAGEVSAAAPPLTLAHNVASEAEVAAFLKRAAHAGATLLKPAELREWGGVSGYFADPDGFVWEVAHNPGLRTDADGNVSIGAIEG